LTHATSSAEKPICVGIRKTKRVGYGLDSGLNRITKIHLYLSPPHVISLVLTKSRSRSYCLSSRIESDAGDCGLWRALCLVKIGADVGLQQENWRRRMRYCGLASQISLISLAGRLHQLPEAQGWDRPPGCPRPLASATDGDGRLMGRNSQATR
jgi:uncharacterized protein YfiM (DUF2279 family)